MRGRTPADLAPTSTRSSAARTSHDVGIPDDCAADSRVLVFATTLLHVEAVVDRALHVRRAELRSSEAASGLHRQVDVGDPGREVVPERVDHCDIEPAEGRLDAGMFVQALLRGGRRVKI